MNLAIFIHGKVSNGKDTFVRAVKYIFGCYLSSELKGMSISDVIDEINKLKENRPSIFDTEDIVTMPFADEVRKELCRLDPTVDYTLLCKDYNYKAKYRKQLVEIGDGYRKNNPGIWIDKHYLALKEFCSNNNGKVICIPDMRYSTNDAGDEFEYARNPEIPDLLTLTVKIKASLPARLSRMSPEGIKAYINYGMHNASENAMDHIPDDKFDFVCDNSTENNTHFNSSLLSAAGEIFSLFEKIKNI